MSIHQKAMNDKESLRCAFCHEIFPSLGDFIEHSTNAKKCWASAINNRRIFVQKITIQEAVNNTEFNPGNSIGLKKSETLQDALSGTKHACDFSDAGHYTIPCDLMRNIEASSVCEICGKIFPTLQQLKSHAVKHKRPANHVCHHCGQVFDESHKLKHHFNLHTGISPYKCEKCGQTFHSPQAVVCHKRVHDEGKFQCTVCPKAFKRREVLENHMKRHTGEKPFMCSVCGVGLKNQTALRLHLTMHSTGDSKPFKCPYVGCTHSGFATPAGLNIHLKGHAPPGEMFGCELCELVFNHVTQLREHRHQEHSGRTNRRRCSQCGKWLATTKSLRLHLESHAQKGVPPHLPCVTCGKKFHSAKKLAIHRRLHDDLPPFSCHVAGCHFRYHWSWQKRKHVEQEHSMTDN